jgi:hypothetical protein
MRGLELRDIFFGPGAKAASRAQLDIADSDGRIIVSQSGRDCDGDHRPQDLEKTPRRMRGRNFLGEHGLDVLSLEAPERFFSMNLAKTLKNVSLGAFRFRCEVPESHRSEIDRDGRRDGTGLAAGGANLNPWRGLASERRRIGFHEFGRAGQARKGDALAAGAAEVMADLAVPVTKSVNVLYLKVRQGFHPMDLMVAFLAAHRSCGRQFFHPGNIRCAQHAAPPPGPPAPPVRLPFAATAPDLLSS